MPASNRIRSETCVFSNSETASAIARRSTGSGIWLGQAIEFGKSHVPCHRLREEARVIPHFLGQNSGHRGVGFQCDKAFRLGSVPNRLHSGLP